MPDSFNHPAKKAYPSELEDITLGQAKEEDGNTEYSAASTPDVQRLRDNALEMLERLYSFSNLHENWDSYGAAAPTTDALEAGKKFIEQLAEYGQQINFTSPGSNGEVSVELKSGSKYMEFVFYPARKWKYTAFENKLLAEQGNYNPDKLPSLLHWLNN